MGWKRSDSVSDHEQRRYQPSLKAALTYQVLYGVPVHELFPEEYEEVEHLLKERAQVLLKETAANKRSGRLLAKMGRLQQLASPRTSDPAHVV